MTTNKYVILFSQILCVLQMSAFCLSSRLPISSQRGASERLGNNPNALSLIGSYENVTYWQESISMIQSEARSSCFMYDLQLCRPRNQDHLDFLAFEGGRDGSWTDGITFYERGMYQPVVHSTIPVVHYINLGLRIEAATRSLVPEDANMQHPSICSVEIIEDKKTLASAQNNGDIEENKILNKREVAATPKFYLGSYNGYQYHQDPVLRSQIDARNECEANGHHLATFVNKQHLDFISSQGALDGSWTNHNANVTRDVFKWGNNSPISTTIRINPFPTPLGLVIGTEVSNHRLQAVLENTLHPSICMLHVGP